MYLDSAILVKLVVREPDSLFYAERVDGQTEIWSSQLSLTECWSALDRKQREGSIDSRLRKSAWRKLETLADDGMLGLVPVNRSLLHRANQIIERCSPRVPIRALDAIHLASCEAMAAFPLLTSDSRMRAAADFMQYPLGPLP